MRGKHTYSQPALAKSPADLVLVGVVAVAVLAGTGTWLTGQLAAALFMGRWPAVSFADALQAAIRIPGHLAP
jgi:hypothetical protein